MPVKRPKIEQLIKIFFTGGLNDTADIEIKRKAILINVISIIGILNLVPLGISALMSPGIDGLETYEKIISLHPSQKAIIASGFSETDRVKKAQQLGAGAYVRKPYTIETIGMAVKEELEKDKKAA